MGSSLWVRVQIPTLGGAAFRSGPGGAGLTPSVGVGEASQTDRSTRAISQDAPPSAPSSASPQGARMEDGGRGEAPRGRRFPSPRPPPPPRRLPGIPRSPEPSVTEPSRAARPDERETEAWVRRPAPRRESGPGPRGGRGGQRPGSRPAAALAPVRGLEGLKANCGRREPGQSPGEAATPTPLRLQPRPRPRPSPRPRPRPPLCTPFPGRTRFPHLCDVLHLHADQTHPRPILQVAKPRPERGGGRFQPQAPQLAARCRCLSEGPPLAGMGAMGEGLIVLPPASGEGLPCHSPGKVDSVRACWGAGKGHLNRPRELGFLGPEQPE